MPEVGTLEDLKEYMFKAVKEIGENFADPDDDWIMVGAFEDQKGQIHLGEFPNQAFASEASKDALAMMIKGFIDKMGIVNYALLFNVHGVARPDKGGMEEVMEEQRRTGKRLQEYEDSFELLMLVCGDKTVERVYQAKITRDGVNPPILEEWEEIQKGEGRFTDFNEAIGKIEI